MQKSILNSRNTKNESAKCIVNRKCINTLKKTIFASQKLAKINKQKGEPYVSKKDRIRNGTDGNNG